MQIKTIHFKRIKNLGNYESEHLELTAEVEENEDIDKAIEELKDRVYRGLGLVESKTDEELIPPF